MVYPKLMMKLHLDSTEFDQTMALYRQLQTDPTFVLEALQQAAGVEGSGINLEEILERMIM